MQILTSAKNPRVLAWRSLRDKRDAMNRMPSSLKVLRWFVKLCLPVSECRLF